MNNREIIICPQLIKLIKRGVWKRGPNECWPWEKAKIDGYGRISLYLDRNTQVKYLAHRVAYVIAHGSFDWDLNVCHDCDNRKCCNPVHLFLGTDYENTLDCINKGRKIILQGVEHGMSKLDDEKIKVIRAKYLAGVSQKRLANEFNVTIANISDIVNYKIWRHLP